MQLNTFQSNMTRNRPNMSINEPMASLVTDTLESARARFQRQFGNT